MSCITTADGTEIFYKDWGSGQPVVFSHGWPLTSHAWDARTGSSRSTPVPRTASPAPTSSSSTPTCLPSWRPDPLIHQQPSARVAANGDPAHPKIG
jgi:pimeloyl-ACP methyl ester carboxylesterase